MKIRALILSLLFVNFISCNSKDVMIETDLSILDKQQQLWESNGIDSYTFTQSISCFCSEEYRAPREVVVRDGVIVFGSRSSLRRRFTAIDFNSSCTL